MKTTIVIIVTSLAMATMAQTAAQFATGSSFAGTGVNTGVGAQTTINGTSVNSGTGAQTPVVGTGLNTRANLGFGNDGAMQGRIANQVMLAQIAAAAAAQQAATNATNGGSFDRAFLRKATADSLLEIAIARIAETNSTNPAVQQLAARLEADHAAILEQLEQLADDLGFELPQELRPDQQQRLLGASALNGDRFDRAFVRFLIQMHEVDLRSYQRAAVIARSPDVRAFAREALPLLTEHLVLALEARETLVTRPGSTPSDNQRNG